MQARPRGMLAAAATPVRGDFTIDHERLVMHCRWLLEHGCDGINLLGTTGEATSFSADARLAAMAAIARSGLPVERFLVGTGAAALADAVRLTRGAGELGFGGALLLPPFYYKGIDTTGLVAYVTDLVAALGRERLALYLYHFPALSGVPYTKEVVAELLRRFPGTVRGLKDSSGDLPYSAALAEEFPGFDVFPSAEGAMATAEGALFAGCISATLNVTAPVAAEGRFEEAAAIRALFTPLPLIAAVKAALAERYDDAEWNRVVPPLRPLHASERQSLLGALAQHEARLSA
jgi:4-hydroxy-tetrahydrodipicolinate synthase